MHDHPRRARRPSRALERRGQAGSAKESAALAVEAAKLKGHLTKLAKAAHLDPAQWAPAGDAAPAPAGAAAAPSRHHYLDDDSRDWPEQARSPRHYLDDDSVGRAVSGVHHYIDDDSREVAARARRTQARDAGINVGVLGRTPQQRAARGRHGYVDDRSWQAAPKQDQWGQEQLGKAGAVKKAIGFYNYGNPTHLRPWQYGPKESAFGADFVPGVKGQKDVSFDNSWKKVGKDDSWKIAPAADSLLNKVKRGSQGGSVAAAKLPGGGKAWAKAEEWFKSMKRATAKQAEEQQEQQQEQQQVKAAVEARMHAVSHLDKSVSSRVASDLKVLQEARAAEAALRKTPARAASSAPQRAAPVVPVAAAASAGTAQAGNGGDSERDDALARTEGMLNDLIASDDSKFGGDPAAESAAQREQAGWQAAAEDAAADKPLAAAGSLPTDMEASMPASVLAAVAPRPHAAPAAAPPSMPTAPDAADLQTMARQLQQARAELSRLPPADRAAAKGAITAMQAALKGARVSAAAVQRNERKQHVMGKAAKVAATQVSSLEEDPVVRQAEAAQQKVWRLQQQLLAAKSGSSSRAVLRASDASKQIHQQVMAEAAQAAARGLAAKSAAATGPQSRLAKLGINTGEGVWGDDVASPVDKYQTGFAGV